MMKASSSDGGMVPSRAAASTPLVDTLALPVAPRCPRDRRNATPAALWTCALTLLAALAGAGPAGAHGDPGEPLQDGASKGRGSTPEAIPDIFGPGAVLNVGNVVMKVTNYAIIGNPFTNVSSDPSGQWPGTSGIEYLNFIALSVGGVNPTASDPASIRRVSYFNEWRPPTLDPEDKMYRAYDGIVNGTRFGNDDGDKDDALDEPKVDEDFLDGRDNDGDGKIDEDYAAIGQQMYSCLMRDDTPQAINTTFNEKHVPLGLECRQTAWAYSIAGFQDFNVVQYDIYNRSGHTLDSLTIGWRVDMDCGPVSESNYYQDDFDLPKYPSGVFVLKVGSEPGNLNDPARAQLKHDPALNVNGITADSALCPRVTIRINGFSVTDDNGDLNKTRGIGSFLLIAHTLDPTGINGPSRVGFRSFRSYTGGTPYQSGGNPTIDQQRFEFLTSTENITNDPSSPYYDGLISQDQGETKGDYQQWCSVGPWRNVPNDGMISATIAFAVKDGNLQLAAKYPTEYARYVAGSLGAHDLIDEFPSLGNALTAQLAYEGINEVRDVFPAPNYHGRETPLRAARGGASFFAQDCRDEQAGTFRLVHEPHFMFDYTWFDFDCDYCTGVYVYGGQGQGLFHKTWNAAAPPPNPNLNVGSLYNYSDNPDRKVVPAGDRSITLAWDNLSETTPDPKSGYFDFRGYKIWKVSDWTRPVGSPGPSEADWRLIGEFRQFNYEDHGALIQHNYPDSLGPRPGNPLGCPEVFIPNYYDPATKTTGPARVPICLDRGDFWDHQSGQILKPDPGVACVKDAQGKCKIVTACRLNESPCKQDTVTLYPIGRYRYVDREVKNGFLYFYSVTSFDSTGVAAELGGRRSGTETDGVVPQATAQKGRNVWVVPNPYRGYARITQRPSTWDLTPNASDPTGTHIDFMGLPPDKWTIRIYTVAGDLVQELHSEDAVNESLRSPIKAGNGQTYAGYNRQQDNPNDGQARWNLISRNGQDIVSGIYLFTVESNQGTQRGRFVVIR